MNSTYRVRIVERAQDDLRRIRREIGVRNSAQARTWFSGLEEIILSLSMHPQRGGITPEAAKFRQLLYGRRPHVYRVIYTINEQTKIVRVLHIRHGRQDSFTETETGP